MDFVALLNSHAEYTYTHTLTCTHAHAHTHACTHNTHTHTHTLPQGSLDDPEYVLITVEGDMTRMKDRSPT